MDQQSVIQSANKLAEQAQELARAAQAHAADTAQLAVGAGAHEGTFMSLLTVFVLAVFVGYHVVWRVTPALHSPLMAVTNAISSVIIVGALLAAGLQVVSPSSWLGFAAVVLASINIFGGFIVTQRMLDMFKKKQK